MTYVSYVPQGLSNVQTEGSHIRDSSPITTVEAMVELREARLKLSTGETFGGEGTAEAVASWVHKKKMRDAAQLHVVALALPRPTHQRQSRRRLSTNRHRCEPVLPGQPKRARTTAQAPHHTLVNLYHARISRALVRIHPAVVATDGRCEQRCCCGSSSRSRAWDEAKA